MRAAGVRAEHARDEDSVAGRVALVTGGTGAAISLILARAGAAVAAGFSSNRATADGFRQTLLGGGTGASVHRATWATPRTACGSYARWSSSTAGSTSLSTTPASRWIGPS